jgi:hypothetical protein
MRFPLALSFFLSSEGIREAEKRMKVHFSCVILYFVRLSKEVASTTSYTTQRGFTLALDQPVG